MIFLNTGLVSLDRREFGFWRALVGAFFSSRLYVDVAKRWRGFGFFFLLGVFFIAGTPFGVRCEYAIYNYCQDYLIEPLEHFPTLSIQEGHLEWNSWMPYRMLNKNGKTVLMVDTTDTVTKIDHKKDPDLTWLLTADSLHFSPPVLQITPNLQLPLENAARVTLFDPGANDTIVLSELGSSGFKLAVYTMAFLAYPCVICVLLGTATTILAAFAWAAQYYIRVVFRYKMSYQAVCRLLAVSFTPPLFMSFFIVTFGINFSNDRLYAFLLFALYFNFGVLSVRRVDRAMVFA